MIKVNNREIIGGNFPNKEKYYIPISSSCNGIYTVQVTFCSNEDLFDLLLYKKYLDDEHGREKDYQVNLVIAFMPYGQSDRKFSDKIFAFKYFAKLINEANFARVIIFDPHSPVMTAIIDRCEVFYPCIDLDEYDLVCYPDNGAAKKYSEIHDKPYIFGNKKRNLETGEIIRYEIIADREDVEGKKILIIDDICMGGRTFKEAAKALLEMGAGQVDLQITHLMPQAEDFYENYKDFGITKFHSFNTLKQDWYKGAKR